MSSPRPHPGADIPGRYSPGRYSLVPYSVGSCSPGQPGSSGGSGESGGQADGPSGADLGAEQARGTSAASRVLVVANTTLDLDDVLHLFSVVGLRLQVVTCQAEALAEVADHPPEAVLIDEGTGTLDAATITRSLRAAGFTGGIVARTSSDRELRRVEVLDDGADDCAGRPTSLRETVARIQAVLRRAHRPYTPTRYVFTPSIKTSAPTIEPSASVAGLLVDPSTRRACFHDVEVPTTRLEFDVLLQLVTRAQTVVTREELAPAGWPRKPAKTVSSSAMHAAIARIRKNLAAADAPHRVVSVHGIGYMLTVPHTPVGATTPTNRTTSS